MFLPKYHFRTYTGDKEREHHDAIQSVPEGPAREIKRFQVDLADILRAGASRLYVDVNTLTACDGTLIIKEFAVVCSGVSAVSLLIKSPNKLTERATANSHGIPWTTGSVTLSELRSFLTGLFGSQGGVYVRGEQNARLVKKLLNVPRVVILPDLPHKSEHKMNKLRCKFHRGRVTVRGMCSLENVVISMVLP